MFFKNISHPRSNRRFIYSVWKDAEYLKWRYETHPEKKYRFHYLTKGHDVVALAVTRSHEKTQNIVEWMVKDKNPQWSDYLLQEIKRRSFNGKFQAIKFVGLDNGFYSQTFKSFKTKQLQHHLFCLRPLKKAESYSGVALPFNWSVTLGDWDDA